MYALSIL